MCFDRKIPNQMELYNRLTMRVNISMFGGAMNTSDINIQEPPVSKELQYAPGSFSVDASSHILYHPFNYNDVDDENSVRIYESGIKFRPTTGLGF
jgi:hypothetical protein